MAIEVGDIVEGVVLNIMQYGAFIQLEDNKKGLVHISEVSNKFVNDINTILKPGQVVKAKVISVSENKIALSIKQLEEKQKFVKRERKFNDNGFERRKNNNEDNKPKTFEDILTKFMKDSEERQTDIKKSFESKRGSGSNKRV